MRTRAGGIDIGYDECGDGPAVIFLHGFPHNRKLWAPQLGALSGQSRCIAPDLRGFGESSVESPFSMDRYADDVAALMDAASVERATILGLSMGGYVAFAFWRRYPNRVRALILADTRAGADSEEGKAKRRDMIVMARERGPAAVADSVIAGMVGKTTRERDPELVESVRTMLASAPVDGIVGALEAMIARQDSTPTLSTIDVPTLVLVGAEDTLTPVKEAELLHGSIAGSVLQLIPSAGHVSNFERPAAFNYLLSDFLSDAQA